jgi:hypothetical protein
MRGTQQPQDGWRSLCGCSAAISEFASVNILLGNLKTAITGTYHAVDFARYSCRYLAEYLFRFNRRYRMREMLPPLPRAVACATALSTALARAPEDAC